MTQCVVWLEVDGELRKCTVQSPWADQVLRVNGMRHRVDTKEFKAMTRGLADQIVASGEFVVHY